MKEYSISFLMTIRLIDLALVESKKILESQKLRFSIFLGLTELGKTKTKTI